MRTECEFCGGNAEVAARIVATQHRAASSANRAKLLENIIMIRGYDAYLTKRGTCWVPR